MSRSLLYYLFALAIIITGCTGKGMIDRYALVSRHLVEITEIDSLNTLTVGNGKFAFSTDITGLQTFPGYYSKGIPLGTMSEWGWHSEINTMNYKVSDVYKSYNVHGREVNYVHRYSDRSDPFRRDASEFLRMNPHRVHLGLIGLQFPGCDENDHGLSRIKEPQQQLNLWKGEILSEFSLYDTPVSVTTICHPDQDMISARVESKLVGEGKLRVIIDFNNGINSPSGFGLNYPVNHSTTIVSESDDAVIIKRQMDNDTYYVKLFKGAASFIKDQDNSFLLEARSGNPVVEFSCLFTKEFPVLDSASFVGTRINSEIAWQKFWLTGGAVDFSGSTDPRASELERRVVLSRYLTRIQCAGSLPPAETGLTFNSWYGKFHLEMHWWHAVHFALWQNEDVLKRQMEYYSTISGKALKTASEQGYSGVRWPKMTDPLGNESPSGVGTYLIWQQPHFIYFAELLYQNADNKAAVVDKYKDLVYATADFMASYAWYDTATNRYILGPVLISAQESLPLETTVNPAFELTYWSWGLKTAAEWKKRDGQDPDRKWIDIIEKLSPLPVVGNVYLCSETAPDTWENPRYMRDHPIISGIKGMLPETGMVDDRLLGNSLDTINSKWNWQSCWGWDFPMLAMSAAAIDRPEQAVDFLMMEARKNRYLKNGHNYQDARLTIYLPGNGGLLSAVAMMCSSDRFPKNGKWKVRWENLNSIR